MKNKLKYGFSYIEVIISIALIAIIFVPLSNSLYNNLNNYVDALDSRQASDIAVKIIENLKKKEILTEAFDNFTYQISSDTSIFLDTYTISVFRKGIGGQSNNNVICSYLYISKH